MKTALLVLCFVSLFLTLVCATLNRHTNSALSKTFASSIVPRKVDVDRQGGLGATLIAGPIFLALSTLLLPFLPLLLIAPLFAGIGPTLGTLNDVATDAGNPQSPLNEALQAFTSIASDLSTGGSGTIKPGSGSSASASSPSATIHKPPKPVSNNRPDSDSGSESEQSLLQQLATFADDGSSNEGLFPLLSALASSSQSSSGSDSTHKPSLQQLAGNALTSISNFLFNSRRSEHPIWKKAIKPPFPLRNRQGMVAYFKEMFNTLKNGLRRYEIRESECQQRLVCELHQKVVGRNMRPIANVVLDSIGLENQLERSSQFTGRTKSALKDFYKAMKNGISEKECAEVYSRCPVNIAVEPSNNLFNGLFRRKSPKEKPFDYVTVNQNAHAAMNSKLKFNPTPVIYVRNPS